MQVVEEQDERAEPRRPPAGARRTRASSAPATRLARPRALARPSPRLASACATCTYQVGATASSARAPSSPPPVQQAVERSRTAGTPRRRPAAPSSGRARRTGAPAARRARRGSPRRGWSCRCPARPSRDRNRPRPSPRPRGRPSVARSSSRPTVRRSADAGAALERRLLRVPRSERRQCLLDLLAVGRSAGSFASICCTSRRARAAPPGSAAPAAPASSRRMPPAPPASSARRTAGGRRAIS